MKKTFETAGLFKPVLFCLVGALITACGGSDEDNVTSTVDGTTINAVPRDQQVTDDNNGGDNTPDTTITVDDNTTGGNNNGENDTGNEGANNDGTNDGTTGGDTGSTPPPEPPSLGQSFFGALCSSCHGDNGEGTPNGSSLVKMWDATALRNKIDNDMPPSGPVACSGLCAETTTEYIIDAFTPRPDDNTPPPPPPAPYAIISTPDNLTDFAPHNIALEARFSGISGTPLIQWYLDNQLVAEGVTYNANFVVPGRHVLNLVITSQDNVQLNLTENISIMGQDHVVDECSPPIEFYAIRIGPNIVEADCTLCHTENGVARNSGLVFESLAVRGGLTTNYREMASYSRTPNVLLDLAAGRGHSGGERLNLSNTNSPLYQDLLTFLNIEAETPAACLVQ